MHLRLRLRLLPLERRPRRGRDEPQASRWRVSVVVGGAGCDEMKQAKKDGATGRGQADFSTGRYASGVLSAPNASVLNWVLIDSEDGTHLDGAVLHAQQQQPAAVEAA